MTELIATDLDYSVKGAGLVRSASLRSGPARFHRLARSEWGWKDEPSSGPRLALKNLLADLQP